MNAYFKEMNTSLDITDEQFAKLGTSQKLDVLYVNQKRTLTLLEGLNGLRRYQKIQWWSIGALASAMSWLFIEFLNYIKT